jgi:hypothetical protein
MAESAHVMDIRTKGVLIWVALLRVMVLWVLLFAADKVYQSAFVDRGLNNEKDEKTPPMLPHLWTIMPIVLLCETLFMLAIFILLRMLCAMYGGSGTFVVDADLISRVLYGYLVSTAVLALLGSAMGNIVQCRREFRYEEDGLRGIRALCILLLPTAIVVIAATTFLTIS